MKNTQIIPTVSITKLTIDLSISDYYFFWLIVGNFWLTKKMFFLSFLLLFSVIFSNSYPCGNDYLSIFAAKVLHQTPKTWEWNQKNAFFLQILAFLEFFSIKLGLDGVQYACISANHIDRIKGHCPCLNLRPISPVISEWIPFRGVPKIASNNRAQAKKCIFLHFESIFSICFLLSSILFSRSARERTMILFFDSFFFPLIRSASRRTAVY